MDLTHEAALFILQIGVVLVAAKFGGELFERWFRQPAVLGELLAGVLIGPYALGAYALPGIGHLFGEATAGGAIPIPLPLWAFAEMGAVVLLFVSGLETDFRTFLRFGPAATVVAIGGVILPFIFGDVTSVALGLAPGYASAEALFVGAALTATSVGVTARVLSDIGRLDTPEGATILGAAVFDDVIGILVLAVVVAIAAGGSVDALQVGIIGGRALLAYVALSILLIVVATRVASFFNGFRSAGASVALALALGLVSGYVAQSVGLAMIVGAFSAGIALSRATLPNHLRHDMRAIAHIVVPVFFVVVGMLVDVRALANVFAFGVLVTLLASVGKLVGCGLPAAFMGFRPIGAIRIGVGMIPRGEVALIIAGIGLSTGAVGQAVFAVVVFMTFATTIVAPIALVPLFARGGRGFGSVPESQQQPLAFDLSLPADLLDQFTRHLVASLAMAGFVTAASSEEAHFIEFRRGDEILVITTHVEGPGKRRVRVESENPLADWPQILSRAASASESELSGVLSPVLGPR